MAKNKLHFDEMMISTLY